MDLPGLQALEARGHWGIKKGLDNIQALLEELGHPQRAFPPLLIAGTNGKGSTGAFLAHALKACGLRVGWTTSPHLVSPTERIWVDGAPIAEAELDARLQAVLQAEARAGVQATYFELMLAAALLEFCSRGVQMALVEVGMGGRWDSTNALAPLLTVLTSVGLDHAQHLGGTLEAIAREKLCTARDGRPLVLGPGLDPAWIRPLLECAPMLYPAPPLTLEAVDWDGSRIGSHRIALPGAHQASNLATALEVLRQLRYFGLPLPAEAVWHGIERTVWPGRLWKVPGLQEVWMDGAHNPDGARVLAAHAQACGVRPHLCFGAMGDKDLHGIAQELRLMAPRSLTFIQGANERYATGPVLREAWGLDAPVISVAEAAARLREPAEGLRLVTGSLYLLGDLLRELKISPQL